MVVRSLSSNLDGPLFFGSAERAERVVGDELSASDWVLLDLKRISHFDISGVLMLKRLDELLVRSGRRLFLAPLLAGGRRQRRWIGQTGRKR
jgi:MFS superfamily sulfate permease-like transporter